MALFATALGLLLHSDSFARSIALGDLESASLNKGMPNVKMLALPRTPYLVPPASKDAILYPKLFGSMEVKSSNISIFPKWTAVLARSTHQISMLDKGCIKSPTNPCAGEAWLNFLDTLRHKNRMEQINAVNSYMNSVRYIKDSKNWKINDYWETPLEFLERNGDCEDYAIAKFISLRMLGIPDNAMRIVIVNDQNIRAIHAVLTVYVNGKAYLLDNQIKQLIAADSVRHYRPIYSINEQGWWRHRVS